MEPDALTCDYDGVTVDNTGLALNFSVSRGGQKCEEGEEDNSAHAAIVALDLPCTAMASGRILGYRREPLLFPHQKMGRTGV